LVIHTGNAEKISDARAMAVADVGSAVSFATMNQLVVTPLIDPHLILNADATQFTVGDTGAEKEKLKYIGKRGTKALKEEPRKENCGIARQILQYQVSAVYFAAGTNLIQFIFYILADDYNMCAEDLDVQNVSGLGIGTDIGSIGYVVSAKQDVVTSHFIYDWFNRELLLPFIAKIIKENFNI
jgi:hypothetical protein